MGEFIGKAWLPLLISDYYNNTKLLVLEKGILFRE
jgi:hypothetical protein